MSSMVQDKADADPGDWWDEVRAFDRAVAAGRIKIVFLCGMARSGTTWLDETLRQHAGVAGLGELNVFSSYLQSVPRYIRHFAGRSVQGFGRFMTEDDCGQALRPLLFRALAAAVPDWRGRLVLVDKTPDQENDAAFILRVVPEARFLHIRRDPRAVIASWRAGSRTFAPHWRRYRSIQLAHKWLRSQDCVESIRALDASLHCVSYEELHADGPGAIGRVFAWLGVPVSPTDCAAFLEASRIDAMRERRRATPVRSRFGPRAHRASFESFLRRGTVGGWERDLARAEIARIEHVTGEAMARLGYAPVLPKRRWLPSVTLYWASWALEKQTRRVAGKMRR